ncbi:MAG: 3-mercaptopyruvate sulfurtransferase [Rhodospirillaceae bacterium]|nr:3-mercaptopyruvate sulfurtransferase [Rhodospirillaceae bacterium]MBL6930593.1 3-mercaptopyruvate sulfurtransferase [Rhodospirillales bacterium]
MEYLNPDALVSTDWLEQHLMAPDVRIVDATFYLPHDERNAAEEYSTRHIPGAVYFNIDEICDNDTDLPHMLPSPEKFSSMVRKLGLGDGNRIVVYDNSGGFMAACRVWWMFRIFGHADIAVLDGGLPKWMAEKRPVNDDEVIPQPRHFSASLNHTLVKNLAQMMANIENHKYQVVDARSPGRFDGIDHEPRPTEKRGHIPGSRNLPFNALLNPNDNFTFKSADEILGALDSAGIDLNKPITASCGSGVTASVTALALYLVGHDEVAVYDGSWAEWGDHPDTPVGP